MCYAPELQVRISMQIILSSLLNRWRNMAGGFSNRKKVIEEKGLRVNAHDVQYMSGPPAEFR